MEQELIEILISLNAVDDSKKKEASEALLDGAAKLTDLAKRLKEVSK